MGRLLMSATYMMMVGVYVVRGAHVEKTAKVDT